MTNSKETGADTAHEHDREVDWVKTGKRGVFFKVYCTTCGEESTVHRLPGHTADRNGFPRDMAQACDDVLDEGDKYLPDAPSPLDAEWLADYEARFGKPFSPNKGV